MSWIGWIATTFSLLYKVPQMYTLYTVKQTTGLSLPSLVCQLTSYVFYMIHGTYINDYPVVCMGAISSVQSTVLLFMFYMYTKRKAVVHPTL